MLTITVELAIPQLDRLGDRLVDALTGIKTALDEVVAALDTELPQIAAAIQAAAPDTTEVQEVVTRLNTLRDRIHDIVPDTPAPTP